MTTLLRNKRVREGRDKKMLSCSCYGDYDTWYDKIPEDFKKFNCTRRKKCVSCKRLVNIGENCLEFEMYRIPHSDIEMQVMGYSVPMANKYMCENCGEIYLNLSVLGYCPPRGYSMLAYA